MALKAGTSRKDISEETKDDKFKSTYENSMAEAMEKAFLKEWPKIIEDQPAPDASDQMRLLFIAIAQGIVYHLVKKAGAISIELNEEPSHDHQINPGGNDTRKAGRHSHDVNIVEINADETLYDLNDD